MHSVTITHMFKCSACDAVERTSIGWAQMQQAPTPSPPPGWQLIGERAFCPKHEVTLKVRPARKKDK